jgi:catechol 2,3-dioxygenase-like lactoylglutathione lyase family enzyme
MWLACFHVEAIPAALKLIERRGLTPRPTRPSAALIDVGGLTMALTDEAPWPVAPAEAGTPAAVAALDHVVVATPNAERALANYGARFGLDLRLDRENAQWGARQLFFRCSGAVFEVGASLKTPPSDGPDRFGGLAWRVDDPAAIHARLAAAGFDVSELRKGRKPGTQVFTVRHAPDGASLGGVPTLMIQQNATEPA